MIFVLGHGHGATRLIASALAKSGVFMGHCNDSLDHVPADSVYQAIRAVGARVKCTGLTSWDFGNVCSENPTPGFERLLRKYLAPIVTCEGPTGVKLPELMLGYPWLVKMYPEAKFLWWERDPRNVISHWHMSNNLNFLGVPTTVPTRYEVQSRCLSWAYCSELLRTTPRPEHMVRVTYEEYVADQRGTLDRLESFLSCKLVEVPIVSTQRPEEKLPEFFESYLKRTGVYVRNGCYA